MKAVLLAAAVALVCALFGTRFYIRFLVSRAYGQFIRDDGPTGHHTKRGTPTMGGAVIIGATVAGYFVPACQPISCQPMCAPACPARSDCRLSRRCRCR